jgi:DNA-binding NarL/FixJ family response regulator
MISISIVDDEAELRQSISTFLNNSPGFRCVSSYGNGEDALRHLPTDKPDVILMDINMKGMNGIECVRQLKTVAPQIQIMMLTVYQDTKQIFEALAAGATGYLLKRLPPEKLLEAITEVNEGGGPMSGFIARKVIASFQKVQTSGKFCDLTTREQMVLDCLAKGITYKQIASELNISLATIRTHIRHIYEKLQVHSRTEAVVMYLHR